ncbi:unnamed protein product [Camellia sinensis]
MVGALVQVYTDGTVLVAHRGAEMGQGLHTKVAQRSFLLKDAPIITVQTDWTSTPTRAHDRLSSRSCGWWMEGKECIHVNQALATACYMERIDLSAHGFYITPDIGFDWKIGKGNPFRYFTYGAAFAEVEIDTLTGDFHTRTTNIFLDLGYFINPAIDVGQWEVVSSVNMVILAQIEGAFIQSLGWVALEELKWGDATHRWIRPGSLYTCGPGSYKIPSLNDVPFKFSVSLLKVNTIVP